MFSNSTQCMVGHGVEACNIQCQQTVAPIDDRHNPVIRQFGASGQGESFDPLATHEWLHRSIAYLVAQTGQVEALHESEIGEVAILFPYCLDHVEEICPAVAEWSVPEKIDGIS